MGDEDEEVKKGRVIEVRARKISNNVRWTECGSLSIEDSQANVAILLRKAMIVLPEDFLLALGNRIGFSHLIRDEIQAGKMDKEIYKKLEEDFGETVLYTPMFDMQTAALWLSPLLMTGGAAAIWAYKKHRQKTSVHIMALNLIRGVPLTPKEKETLLDLLMPPPSPQVTHASFE